MSKEIKDDSYLDFEDDANSLYQEKPPLYRRIGSELISWVPIIIIAIVIATLLNVFVIISAIVPSGSMLNTIRLDDRMIGNRLAYVFGEPERGDIIIFIPPDNPKDLFVKRIIGLPGETVNIVDGKVYINDSEEPLQEDYIYDVNGNPWTDTGLSYTVPKDSYFVMGDNRNNSNDSRYWNNKYVPRDSILAKAAFVYWPISDIRCLGGYDYE